MGTIAHAYTHTHTYLYYTTNFTHTLEKFYIYRKIRKAIPEAPIYVTYNLPSLTPCRNLAQKQFISVMIGILRPRLCMDAQETDVPGKEKSHGKRGLWEIQATP